MSIKKGMNKDARTSNDDVDEPTKSKKSSNVSKDTNNDEYKGIQYIKMTSDGQLLFEAGAVPQLENHS